MVFSPCLNQGVLTPGVLSGRAQIVGDYQQASTGVQLSAFSSTGLVNPLSVKGTAQLSPAAYGAALAAALQCDDRLSVGLDIGSQLGGGYRAVDGQVRVQWAF